MLASTRRAHQRSSSQARLQPRMEAKNLMIFSMEKYFTVKETRTCYNYFSKFCVPPFSHLWGHLYRLNDDGNELLKDVPFSQACIRLGPGPLLVYGSDKARCHYYIECDVDVAFLICRMVSDSGVSSVRLYNTCDEQLSKGCVQFADDEVIKFKQYVVLFHGDKFSITFMDRRFVFVYMDVELERKMLGRLKMSEMKLSSSPREPSSQDD